jgi:predicted enzyme related to lactoylglutathione lyase
MKMAKLNPVVHFEMPAKNKKRVAGFYSKVFGWKMTQLGPDMGSYVLATTSPVDKNNMHKRKGAINGGFYQRGKEGTVPHVVIAVNNLKKSMETVKKSGGKISGKPMKIPGIGDFVLIKDSEDNRVGMLQPGNMR